MNLAARLERLRRPSSAGAEPDLHQDRDGYVEATVPDALVRLARHRYPQVAATGGRCPRYLADALGAEHLGDGLLLRTERVFLPADTGGDGLIALPEVCDARRPDWVYLDTETTGLSGGVGNLAFMVGVARYQAGMLEVRQYVLASFQAEAGLLRELLYWIGPQALLVSYNGKCFDIPLLDGRLRMQRLGRSLNGLRHLDLMYSVRRAFRGLWPDCRLQTAEHRLLGLLRDDDLPGALAPSAWRAWLERGSTDMLQAAGRHNLQDVVSLALLHRRLTRVYAGSSTGSANHVAIARAWHGAGRLREARGVLECARDRLDGCGLLALADLCRREGDWDLAVSLWRELHSRGNPQAASELSKYHEHRRRDYRKAIDYARSCDETERLQRHRRLLGKIGGTRQLRLWSDVDVSGVECDEVARTVGTRQAAPQNACAPGCKKASPERQEQGLAPVSGGGIEPDKVAGRRAFTAQQ